jgi:hypothetical protein
LDPLEKYESKLDKALNRLLDLWEKFNQKKNLGKIL